MEVTFDKTMSASELLVKIDLLSKRLDRIAGIPNCVLGNRCPSALKGDGRSIAANHYGLNKDARKGSMSVGVMRRRTHSAFPLEYREPLCDAVLWARRLKGQQLLPTLRNLEYRNSGPIHSNNLATLPRKVLQGVEANVEDVRQPVEIRVSQRPRKSVEDSSELDGLLGFRAPPHGYSEDFINKRRPCAVSRSRDGIVFTGFPKRKEKELHADVIGLGLKVQKKINKQTHCVISANGERTLNVMRAVILGIPVITATWVVVTG
uniref:BRCT domain-containing protein n=1 Tax=Angiostrongylus cantonensis TaxID=6313 RepID=A0A158PC51_ANGCA